MKEARQEPLPWIAGIGFCLFYLLFHSTLYNFDGVACAIAVELGDFSHLVHGNHLAYGLLGWCFYRLWQAFGYLGPAIVTLQTLDSLLGGAGVGIFCGILINLGIGRRVAIGCACALGLSQAYWLWSLEAQVYILGAFFILLAAREAFKENPRPILLGLYQALAILGHVGHAMFLPAAIYLLWTARHSKKAIMRYGISLAAFVFLAYAAAAALFVNPQSYEAWRIWLLGSAALNIDKSFIWFGGYSWRNLAEWGLMTVRLFADPFNLAGNFRQPAWALSLLAIGTGLMAFISKSRKQERIVLTAALWLVSYAILFASWQPWQIVYRITDLIPLWLLISCVVQNVPKVCAPLLACWVLATGLFNGLETIWPKTDPRRNRDYQQALWIASATPADAWIVVASNDQVYIPYFAHRRPLNMRYYHADPQALRHRLDNMTNQGEPIFIAPEILEGPAWAQFFKEYGIEEFARKEESVLWRVKGKGIPKGSGKKS